RSHGGAARDREQDGDRDASDAIHEVSPGLTARQEPEIPEEQVPVPGFGRFDSSPSPWRAIDWAHARQSAAGGAVGHFERCRRVSRTRRGRPRKSAGGLGKRSIPFRGEAVSGSKSPFWMTGLAALA